MQIRSNHRRLLATVRSRLLRGSTTFGALIAAATLGAWGPLAAGLGLVALVIGGPWGAVIAGVTAAALSVVLILSDAAVAPFLAPLLAVAALASGLRRPS